MTTRRARTVQTTGFRAALMEPVGTPGRRGRRGRTSPGCSGELEHFVSHPSPFLKCLFEHEFEFNTTVDINVFQLLSMAYLIYYVDSDFYGQNDTGVLYRKRSP